MVIDDAGRFLTQRSLPKMALIDTFLESDCLTLSAKGLGHMRVVRDADSKALLRNVSVWSSKDLLAEDCGDAAAEWLSDALSTKCRLVRIGPKFVRPIAASDIAGPGDRVHFADALPFLILGEATLADLNDRLAGRSEQPAPMNRFRPNLVITGSQAFAEDTWTRFRIGEIIFRTAGCCTRCTITVTDQDTAERGDEPLRTLATYRRDPNDSTAINFGQNLIHETKTGTLRLGDSVALL